MQHALLDVCHQVRDLLAGGADDDVVGVGEDDWTRQRETGSRPARIGLAQTVTFPLPHLVLPSFAPAPRPRRLAECPRPAGEPHTIHGAKGQPTAPHARAPPPNLGIQDWGGPTRPPPPKQDGDAEGNADSHATSLHG